MVRRAEHTAATLFGGFVCAAAVGAGCWLLFGVLGGTGGAVAATTGAGCWELILLVMAKTGLKYEPNIPLGKRKYPHYRITMHTREIEKSIQFCLVAGKSSVTNVWH